MPKFALRQDVQQAIRDTVENDISILQEQLGIDHSIPGCRVTNLDPYGVGLGVLPRYIQVALRGEYTYDVYYRGGITGIAVGTELTIKYLSEGKRYEVEGPSGSTGTVATGSTPRQWLADNAGFADFEPDNPAVITTAGVVTEYATIALALAATNPGDCVVIPPGEYDESITLVDDVYVVELVAGTVVINSTSANTAVTTVDGGYIKVKEIRVTRDDNAIQAVLSSHATGICTVIAELIRASGNGNGSCYGVHHTGAGTLYLHAHDVQANNGDSETSALYCEDGITYARADEFLAEGSSAGYSVGVYAYSCEQYVWGDCRATDDTMVLGADIGGENTIQIIHGDCYAITDAAGSLAYGARCTDETEQTVHGDCYAEAVTAAYGAYIQYIDGVQEVYGNCTGTGATTSTGAHVEDIFGGDTLTQRIYGNVTGDTYGARCETGTQTIVGGVAAGGTTDLIHTGGALSIASVQYETYSGTITLLSESLNALQLALVPTTELTISGGVITKTQSYHRVDTESDAASDDLDTINGATATGEILVIRPEDGARTVVVKHNTGNIWMLGGADVTLDDINDHIMLIYDGSKWCSIDEDGAGGGGGAPTGAEYLTLALDGSLTAERVLTPGDGLDGADAGANSTYTLSVDVTDFLGAWMGEDASNNIRFQPDLPAVVTSAWVVTEYATVAAAITAAASGDYVVIPPGTYDEALTLKSGVRVVELFKGTVTIGCTTGIAVSCVNGGYINVAKISSSYSNVGYIRAVYSGLVTTSCQVITEHIYANNTHVGGSGAECIVVTHDGDLYVSVDKLESTAAHGNAFAVRAASGAGTLEVHFKEAYLNTPTGISARFASSEGASFTTKIFGGNVLISSGGAAYLGIISAGSLSLFDISTDIYAYDESYGIYASGGGLRAIFCDVRTTYVGGGTKALYSAVALGGTIHIHGGRWLISGSGHLSTRGAYAIGGTIYLSSCWFKVDTGFDIHRSSGTLYVYGVQYDTSTGTLTLSDGDLRIKRTIYDASSTLDLTTSDQDVPGVTTGAYTPGMNCYADIMIGVFVNMGAGTAACNAGDVLYASLYNGAASLDSQAFVASGNVGTVMFTRWIRVALTAGTSYTLKVRARNNSGNRGRIVASSQMYVNLIPR